MEILSRIPEFIYHGNSIPDILRLYEADLRNNQNFVSQSHANAIRNYRELITDKKFLSVIRKTFDSLYSILEKDPHNLLFSIEGRRKSLISSEEKICKLLYENRSIDLFRDIFAFRVIVFGAESNSLELINQCYSILNSIIHFYVNKGYTLCEEDPTIEVMSVDSPYHDSIIVPVKSGISDCYLYGVKDYIINPKKNGYQSLHCVFRTPAGYCFEVQVRTFGMHVYAVDGRAEHSSYKSDKYNYRIDFDRSRVHIPGYGISDNGTIFDFIGLEKPLSVISRQRTY